MGVSYNGGVSNLTGSERVIEIFNPTLNPVNLNPYSVRRYSNGSVTPYRGGAVAPQQRHPASCWGERAELAHHIRAGQRISAEAKGQSQGKLILNISALKPGLYFVQILSADGQTKIYRELVVQ